VIVAAAGLYPEMAPGDRQEHPSSSIRSCFRRSPHSGRGRPASAPDELRTCPARRFRVALQPLTAMLSNDNGISSTRVRSLHAALEVVRSDGIEGLTTRAIARRSGLTQPAIYRHFAGVDDLARETLGSIRALFLERLQRTAEDGTAGDRLMGALEAFRAFAIEEPRLYDALFLQFADRARAPLPAGPSPGASIFGLLVERVAACIREGTIQSERPVAAALSLAAHVQGLILLHRQGRFGSKERFSQVYRRSMQHLLRGLG
jgi:AcrR family transcriptional regulator